MVDVRRVWTLSVIPLLLMAGCAESPDATQGEPAGADGQEPGQGAAADNVTAPTAVAAVLLNGTALAAENGTYRVPADVNVTFDASQSANATRFTWTATDANGTATTSEGTQAVFVFAAGNHTVRLDAAAGNLSAEHTLRITAYRAAPAVLELVETTEISFSRSAETWAMACRSATQALEFPDGTVTQYVRMVLDPSWTGVAVNVRFVLLLLDGEGNQVLEASRSGGSDNLVLDVDGLALPPGSYTAEGQFCVTGTGGLAPQGSFTVTGQADHYA